MWNFRFLPKLKSTKRCRNNLTKHKNHMRNYWPKLRAPNENTINNAKNTEFCWTKCDGHRPKSNYLQSKYLIFFLKTFDFLQIDSKLKICLWKCKYFLHLLKRKTMVAYIEKSKNALYKHREEYQRALQKINEYHPTYVHDMTTLFTKCQEMEGARLTLFKSALFSVHRALNIIQDSR